MDIEKFEKFKVECAEIFKITEENINDKNMKVSSMYELTLRVYIQEKKLLNQMNIEKEKMYSDLYHYFKFNREFKSDFSLNTKNEVEVFITRDEKYHKYLLSITDQEMQVKYIEEVMDQLKKMTYNIKNYVDLKKIKLGLM